MTYRQSEMYNCAKYLKNLPLQSVSSKGNLQVVDHLKIPFGWSSGGLPPDGLQVVYHLKIPFG